MVRVERHVHVVDPEIIAVGDVEVSAFDIQTPGKAPVLDSAEHIRIGGIRDVEHPHAIVVVENTDGVRFDHGNFNVTRAPTHSPGA